MTARSGRTGGSAPSILLFALVALAALSLAATCVTSVEQQGPAGPWVGEVVNTDDETVFNAAISPAIYDATGKRFYGDGGGTFAGICPLFLLPGEVGAFQAFFVPPRDGQGTPVLPLRAEFPPAASGYPGAGVAQATALFVRETSRDASRRVVTVEVTNNSPRIYSDVHVCAILRDDAGDAVELGAAGGPELARPTPDDPREPYLRPGETMTLEIAFNTLPPGSIQYYPSAQDRTPPPPCCMPGPLASDWRTIDARTFTVTVPPNWAFNPLQGTDSYLGELVGDGFRLEFDHGVFSAGPPSIDREYFISHETIGGFHAQIIYPRPGRGGETTGVFFVDDLTYAGRPTLFNLLGQNLDARQQAIAFEIFRSIRFKPGEPGVPID